MFVVYFNNRDVTTNHILHDLLLVCAFKPLTLTPCIIIITGHSWSQNIRIQCTVTSFYVLWWFSQFIILVTITYCDIIFTKMLIVTSNGIYDWHIFSRTFLEMGYVHVCLLNGSHSLLVLVDYNCDYIKLVNMAMIEFNIILKFTYIWLNRFMIYAHQTDLMGWSVTCAHWTVPCNQ